MSSNRSLLLATVTGVRDSKVCYPSCSECYRKLLRENAGDFTTNRNSRWRCMRCHVDYDSDGVQYRYRLQLTISDGDSVGDVSIFGKTLEPFFGRAATGINRLMCSLREENEKCLQDSETMLLEALQQTFIGHQFWFGVKADQCSSRFRQQHSKKFPTLRLRHILPISKNNNNACGNTVSAINPSRMASLVAFQLIYAWDRQFITVIDNLFSVLTAWKLSNNEVISEQQDNLQIPTEHVWSSDSTSFMNGYSQSNLDAEVNKNLCSGQNSLLYKSTSFASSRNSGFSQQSVWLSCDREESSSSSRENDNDVHESTKSSGFVHSMISLSDENPQETSSHLHPGFLVPFTYSASDKNACLTEKLHIGEENSSNIEILRSEVDQVLGHCPVMNNDDTYNQINSKSEILSNSRDISASCLGKQTFNYSICKNPDGIEPSNDIEIDGINTALPSEVYYQVDYNSLAVNDISKCWDDQSLNDSSFLLACDNGNVDEKGNHLNCHSYIWRTSHEGNSIHSDHKVQKCTDMSVSDMPDSEDIDEFLAHITLPQENKQNTTLPSSNTCEVLPSDLHCSVKQDQMNLPESPGPRHDKDQKSCTCRITDTLYKQQLWKQSPATRIDTENIHLNIHYDKASCSSSTSSLNCMNSDDQNSLASGTKCESSSHGYQIIDVNKPPQCVLSSTGAHNSICSSKNYNDISMDLSRHLISLHQKPSVSDCLDHVSVSPVIVPGRNYLPGERLTADTIMNPRANITDRHSILDPAKRCHANTDSHFSNNLPDSEDLFNMEDFPDSEGLDSFLAKVSLPSENEDVSAKQRQENGQNIHKNSHLSGLAETDYHSDRMNNSMKQNISEHVIIIDKIPDTIRHSVREESVSDPLSMCQNQMYITSTLSVETVPNCSSRDTISMSNDVCISSGGRPCADSVSMHPMTPSDMCGTDNHNENNLNSRTGNCSYSSSVQVYPLNSSLCHHSNPLNRSLSGHTHPVDSPLSDHSEIMLKESGQSASQDSIHTSDFSGDLFDSSYCSETDVLIPERHHLINMCALEATVSDSPIRGSIESSNGNIVLVASTPLPKQSRNYSNRVTQNNDAEEMSVLEQSVCLNDDGIDISNVSGKRKDFLTNKKKRVHFSHRLNFVHELQLIDLRMKINPTKSACMGDSELKSCLKNLQVPHAFDKGFEDHITVNRCINRSRTIENLSHIEDINDDNSSGVLTISMCNSCELFTPSPRCSPGLKKQNNSINSDAVMANRIYVDGSNTSPLISNVLDLDVSIIVPPSTCSKRCVSKIQGTDFTSRGYKTVTLHNKVVKQQTTHADKSKKLCKTETKSLNFNCVPVRLKLIPVRRSLLNSPSLSNTNPLTISNDRADVSVMCSAKTNFLPEINHIQRLSSFNNQSSPELFSQVLPLTQTSVIKAEEPGCFQTLCVDVTAESSTSLSSNICLVTSETFQTPNGKSVQSCSPMFNCSTYSEDLFSPERSGSVFIPESDLEHGTGKYYDQLDSANAIIKHISNPSESPHLSNDNLCKKLFI